MTTDSLQPPILRPRPRSRFYYSFCNPLFLLHAASTHPGRRQLPHFGATLPCARRTSPRVRVRVRVRVQECDPGLVPA